MHVGLLPAPRQRSGEQIGPPSSFPRPPSQFPPLQIVRTIVYRDSLKRNGPVPLYYQVLQVLRGRIASGQYPVGGQLPTDEALMREFGVSRHTVRSALQELVSV